jgi:telomere length regulation protein
VHSQTEVEGAKISEILDDESDEDDDLKPYAKPDSDPEDSDEDATLVTRNKARPPVYIRDLMRMLHNDKEPARFQLGIEHAAKLIRRKTGYGREVIDHAEELAGVLCNLQDAFSTENFDELKLQALIAVLLADVKIMAPWLSSQAFTGDYSISPRCIILSALGLGGRELAGMKNLDDLAPIPGGTDFPSKRLPGRLAAAYAQPTKSLEKATASLEHTMIAPLALSAADKTTQHLDAVKVRTFSSRMQVEARTKRNLPPNSLAKCFSEAFFAPLTGRYQQEMAAYGQGSIYVTTPFLVVTFLKTIALLLHASGPATTDLFDVISIFWSVVLSLRIQASRDISVLEAVLFSLLSMLEVAGEGIGGKERLAKDFAKELEETKTWVGVVFERTGSGGMIEEEGGGDEGRVRRLAAGVLVRIGEVGEAWHKVLTGGT